MSREFNQSNIPFLNILKCGDFFKIFLGLLALGVMALITGCKNIETEYLPSITHSITTKKTTVSTFTFIPEKTITHTATKYSTSTLTITPTITVNPHQYTFPVIPDRSVDYAEGTASHGYPAIDIFAPAGWEYVAVTDGTIEFISYTDIWDPVTDDPGTRGGIAISLIGDDGFRYYGSHLLKIADGIETGQHISAGQLLGYIGESGNAQGTVSHLHFGISRPTFPEDWKTRRGEIDPFPYLNAWAAGINITPRYSTPTPKP
jgi:hypothetical protein